jgi:hypothetical protein
MATPTKAGIAAQDFLSLFVSPEGRYEYKTKWRPEMVEQNEAALAGMTVEEYRAAQEAQARADQKATRDKIAKKAAEQKAADAAAADAAAETETDDTAPRPQSRPQSRPRLNNAVLGAGRFTPQGRAKASDQTQLWYIMGALVLIGGGAAFYSYSRRKK